MSPPSPPSLSSAVLACGFSGASYLDNNPDLREAGLRDGDGVEHFLRHGAREGRTAPLTLDVGAFRRLRSMPDLAAYDRPAILASLMAAHVREWSDALRSWAPERSSVLREAREAGGRPILVFGDSHSILYAGAGGRRGAAWLLPVDLRCIGTSARGLGRVPSTSGNGEAIRGLVERYPGAFDFASGTLFKFGQVDLEFVLVHNAITKQAATRLEPDFALSFAEESVRLYIDFLASLFMAPLRGRVVVASTFPPTLSDARWADGYLAAHIGLTAGGAAYIAAASAIRDGKPVESEATRLVRGFEPPAMGFRTALHRHFNDTLRERSEAEGFRFLDDFSPFLGPDGMVDPRFTTASRGADHHLDPSKASFDVATGILWDHVLTA